MVSPFHQEYPAVLASSTLLPEASPAKYANVPGQRKLSRRTRVCLRSTPGAHLAGLMIADGAACMLPSFQPTFLDHEELGEQHLGCVRSC